MMADTTLNPSTKTCHHFSIEKLWFHYFHIKFNHSFSIEIWWYIRIGTYGYLQVRKVRKVQPLLSDWKLMAGTTLYPSTKTCHHFSIEKLGFHYFHIKFNHSFSIEIWWYIRIGTYGYLQVRKLRKVQPLLSDWKMMAGTTLYPSTKTCHHFSIEKQWFHVKYNQCFSINTWWQAPKGTFGYIRATMNLMMMMMMMLMMMIMMMLVMTMMIMMATMMMMI